MSERMLKIDDVVSKTTLGRSVIYERVAEGSFPAPYSVAHNRVAWKESEINEWISSLPKAKAFANAAGQKEARQEAQDRA